MIRNISDEEARHMVELLKKKSVLIKNFSHKLEKYRISDKDRKKYQNLVYHLVYQPLFGAKKNPNFLIYKELGFLGCGPTWARTRDQLIMSQLL